MGKHTPFFTALRCAKLEPAIDKEIFISNLPPTGAQADTTRATPRRRGDEALLARLAPARASAPACGGCGGYELVSGIGDGR